MARYLSYQVSAIHKPKTMILSSGEIKLRLYINQKLATFANKMNKIFNG